MAVVALANIYNPVTFGRRTQEAQLQLNRFLNSGIAVNDPLLARQIAQGGNAGVVTSYNALTIGEPNYSSDAPGTTSTPDNISNRTMRFRSAQRNKSWSTMDVARELALEDPVGAITGRMGAFWANDDEQRLLAAFQGILADNVANFSSDMLVNVATDSVSAITDAERIGGDRVIDGLQTMGDHKDSLTTIVLHSKIHARLQKQNLISVVRNSEGVIQFETYLGKRIIVDDSMPAVAGTNRITYTCIMFGPGAVGYAPGQVLVPSEIQRIANAGNGGGQDIIHSRVHNVWAPYGFDFTSTTLTGVSGVQANYADLKLAANWSRKDQRKNVPIAFIKVND
jgi:hypothetical protein